MNKRGIINGLYCIITEEYCLGRNPFAIAVKMIEAGVKIIQYREKDKSKKVRYQDCLELRKITKKYGVTFIVNDDLDIALAVGADGVHLGQDDLPVGAARAMAHKEFIIGLSTHSPIQAKQAVKQGVDYIGVGPIYPTNTKKDVCQAVGIDYLDYVVKHINLPFVAIGGIKLHNLPEVLSHGAKSVAMVTEIVSCPDIQGRIKEIVKIFNGV
ncbi:MAG: thiamine phosphate synthase [Elusimicrobia bacterium]|nr:thiamine phosphate synthase [Elusimicrobiota bacterium]